jgi:hypothetical protein
LEYVGIDGRITFKTDLQEVEREEHGLDSYNSEQRKFVGSCEYSNEHPGSTKCKELLH